MFKRLNIAKLFFVFLLIISSISQAQKAAFPSGPDPIMTPGALCQNSQQLRYEEQIKYCARSVSSGLKNEIIRKYDEQFGYSIQKMPRSDFKIDHFIPLSIGGANSVENLWPQHKSVYKYSDPLEGDLSTLMIKGRIKQAEAITIIKDCKLHLEKCEELGAYLKSLL